MNLLNVMGTTKLSDISKNLIASNKIQEVFDLLINYAKNDEGLHPYLNELILLTSRYNQQKRQSAIGVITHAEETLERNKVVHGLLEIVNQLEGNINSVEVIDGENILIHGEQGSIINIAGNYKIEDEIAKADKTVIHNLLQGKSTIKILFLSSNPLDTNPLRLDLEMRDIENELIRSKFRDRFEFIKFSAVRIHDLQDALLNHSPNFVHFSGHGKNEGIALLENKTDTTQIVQSQPLANLFKLFSNDIACVFLNSCYSYDQARLIRTYIPNVIGMNRAVPDNTAIEFAKAFYKGIGAGREISFSFELAKNSIALNNILGSDIPVIL